MRVLHSINSSVVRLLFDNKDKDKEKGKHKHKDGHRGQLNRYDRKRHPTEKQRSHTKKQWLTRRTAAAVAAATTTTTTTTTTRTIVTLVALVLVCFVNLSLIRTINCQISANNVFDSNSNSNNKVKRFAQDDTSTGEALTISPNVEPETTTAAAAATATATTLIANNNEPIETATQPIVSLASTLATPDTETTTAATPTTITTAATATATETATVTVTATATDAPNIAPTVIPIVETIIDTTTPAPPPITTTTTTTTPTIPIETLASTPTGASNESSSKIEDSAQASSANKIARINYTDIEEAFNAIVSEDEVRQRWTKMDNTIKKGVQDVVKMVFPHIASLATDAHVSGDCSGGMLKWMLNLRNLRSWAVKMLDAIGKPGAGILSGQLTMFGNYRQCLDVRAPDEDEIEIYEEYREFFRGKYCVLHVKPILPQKPAFYNLNSTIDSLKRPNYKYYEKTMYDELAELAMAFNFVSIRMDMCVPSLCSQDDIQRVATYLSGKLEMRAKVVRCETSDDNLPPPHADSNSSSSSSSTSHLNFAGLDSTQLNWLLVIVGLVSFVLIASVLSSVCSLLQRRKHMGVTNNSAANNNYKLPHHSGHKTHEAFVSSGGGGGKLSSLLSSMSISSSMQHLSLEAAYEYTCDYYTNDDHSLFGTDSMVGGGGSGGGISGGDTLKPMPLYGVRALLVMWCCLVTATVQLDFQYLRELLPLRSMFMQWPMQFIVNSTWQFESLILLSAFTFAYVSTNEASSSVRQLCRYVLDKFVRLAPACVVLVALTILRPALTRHSVVVGHLIGGPVWHDYVHEPARVCASTGAINVLFLQNYLPYTKICLPQTWIFCVELQLMILSVPLLHWLNRSYEQRGTMRWCAAPTLVTLALIVLGSLWSVLNVYVNQLPPAWLYSMPDAGDKARYSEQHLFLAHTHLCTYFVGLLAGHWARVAITTRAYISKHTSASAATSLSASASSCCMLKHSVAHWTLSLASVVAMLAVVFGTHSWSVGALPDAITSACYDALARLLWSISLAALLWQLVRATPRSLHHHTHQHAHQCNIIVGALSHPLMLVAGRLSLLVYLIYPFVHTLVMGTQEQASFASMFAIFHTFVGNLVLTYALAYLISVLIEQPYRRLVTRHLCSARHCARRLNIAAPSHAMSYPMSEPRRAPRGSITAGIGNIANLGHTLTSTTNTSTPTIKSNSETQAHAHVMPHMSKY